MPHGLRFSSFASARAETKSCVSSAPPIAASQPGAGTSSASQTMIERPCEAATAQFSAKDFPGRALASTLRIAIAGFRAATCRKMARKSSVEPLSAKTTSHGSVHAWETTPSRVSSR